MKVTEHVEYLMRQGKKPVELVELGFPKRVVTSVRRQLREEKRASQPKSPNGRSRTEPVVTPPAEMAPVEQKLAALESEVQKLQIRMERLEALGAEVKDMATRLNGTPALGLKTRFKCDCGASGLVALRIQCTKCGRETWWGWFPKQ